ncbi:hypothetical protein X928_08355 [Petrotoga miotherma DSM 10691]|uniref:Radical SAM core domain-containing protein n=2 Tax=Petrotoga TaxID=28236 RepID=A0A2K1P8H0_9BACT|nr:MULTISPECIES: radical SAM protein [Petrotoga]PNR98996.1 hypothetical protein X928_08355 [Petrotoga miotherma DSM 10691]POZ92040.1 hypothetical protein AA81_09490 [Petrotoga halophila DSM 16923]
MIKLGKELVKSRYLHTFKKGDKTIIFNSLNLEIFEGEQSYYEIINKYLVPSKCVNITKELSELFDSKIIVYKEENESNQALKRLRELRSKALREKKGRIGFMRIDLTEQCNMACSYCFQQQFYKHRQPVMSMEKFVEIMNWFIEENRGNVPRVQYFGGEPLLKFDLIQRGNEMLVDAKNKNNISNYSQIITTNGTLMTKKIADYLNKWNFDVAFSLDGWKDLNDKSRVFKGGQGTYDRVLQGIHNFRSSGGNVNILLTPRNDNLVHIPEIVKHFVEDLGATTVGVNSPQPTEAGWEVEGHGLAKATQKAWEYCIEKNVNFVGPGTFIPKIIKSKSAQVGRCVDGNSGEAEAEWSIYISATGDFSYCLVHHQDDRCVSDDPKQIKQESKFRLWHYNTSDHPECDTCIASQICGGPCSLELALRRGELNPDRCKFYKDMVEWVVKR